VPESVTTASTTTTTATVSTRSASSSVSSSSSARYAPTPIEDDGPYYQLKLVSFEERAEKFHEKPQDAKKKVTMYKIEVKRWEKGKYTSWAIWRRYSQFDKLNDKLQKAHAATGSLPPKDLDKFNPSVIEARVKGLDRYLQLLLDVRSTFRHDAVVAFLEPTQMGDDPVREDAAANWMNGQ